MEEDLFSDPEGYRTALNGIYRLLAQKELYGQQLTWGVASVLGNNYDASLLPGGSTSGTVSYRELAAGDYESAYSTALVDPIWGQGYKVIANCNNMIAYAEEKDPSFFIEGETEKNMILGEALGIRAMVHFDILRLFAPSAKADDGRNYIPYVTTYPEKQPEHLTMKVAVDRVIADLERAKDLLADCDTVFNASRFTAYLYRLQDNYTYMTTSPKPFFSMRGTRLNYFAAAAILARAYQWRGGTGDAERAYNVASDVYRFYATKGWFSFTPSGNLNVAEDNIFRKMPHDILFALYNNNLYTIVTNATIDANTQSFFIKNDDALFGGTFADDYRVNLINTNKTSRRWTIPTGNQSNTTMSDIIKYQGPLAPVSRLSEVIYIMCEYLAEVDLPRAIELLGRVRVARGSKTSVGNPSREDFLKELYLEMTREFLAEGQTFYLYKRLDKPMYNGPGVIDMIGRYTLPAPHSETSYINL
jgi:hypothetical protein